MLDERLRQFAKEDCEIIRDGQFLERDGFRVRKEFIRNIIWPMAYHRWHHNATPPEGPIYVPTKDVTGQDIERDDTRLRIEDEYIGIGCQLITRETLERVAFEEGWFIV